MRVTKHNRLHKCFIHPVLLVISVLLFSSLSCAFFDVRGGSQNVTITAIDKGETDPDNDKKIYYKIYLNRKAYAKTTPGFFFQEKSTELTLKKGRYLFSATRFELQPAEGNELPEYKRANNILQYDKAIYLDVKEYPQMTRVFVGYDHTNKTPYLNIQHDDPES